MATPDLPPDGAYPLGRSEALRLAQRFGHHPATLVLEYFPVLSSPILDAATLTLHFSLTDEAGLIATPHLLTLLRHKQTRGWAVRVWWRATWGLVHQLAAATGGHGARGDITWLDRGICAVALLTFPLQLVSCQLVALTNAFVVRCLFRADDRTQPRRVRAMFTVPALALLPIALFSNLLGRATSVLFGEDAARTPVVVFRFSAHETIDILAAAG